MGNKKKTNKKKGKHNKNNTSREHHNIQLHSRCTKGRSGAGQGGERGDTSNVFFPEPQRGHRLSRQNSNNFSHKDLMNTVFPLMPWKNYTQKKTPTKRDKKVQIFYIFTKISPPTSQPGRWSSQRWGMGRGLCPTSSSSKVPIPQQAGEHGSHCRSERGGHHVPGLDRSASVHPQLGVPMIRGGDHLVGIAVLRAERQLVRGLHAVVDLWEG